MGDNAVTLGKDAAADAVIEASGPAAARSPGVVLRGVTKRFDDFTAV
ncbi:MAG: hypothetical protein JSS97_04375, partial [Actinobacteria bacterium]|nr:hypothetical protein [Actinomycetota bacterium]